MKTERQCSGDEVSKRRSVSGRSRLEKTSPQSCDIPVATSCELATGPVQTKVLEGRDRMTTARVDLYQQVTDLIVAELEKGVAPWVRPWKTLDPRFGGGPFNGVTERAYRGVNVLLLLIRAMKQGYEDPRWFTYRQAQAMGAQVKGGEKATMVIFWKQLSFKEKDQGTGEEEARKVPLLRSYHVFNAAQCDGIAPLPGLATSEPNFQYVNADALFKRHAVDVRTGGDQAFFAPEFDFIQMPRFEAFGSEAQFWGVKLHELTHWTGHAKRLARELSSRFGSEAYAAEELVAEMGSAFLCARLGITGELRHPEYLANWLAVLKKDKRAVFKASSLAQAAADFLLGADKDEEAEPSSADPTEEV